MIGRYAPSPTGDLHLGNLRTAVLAWLFARSDGGRLVLRVEDLDQQRSKPEFVDRQLADLNALGLTWDGPVIRQSERDVAYRTALADLTRRGRTFECFCTRKEIREAQSAPHGKPDRYPGTCRNLTERERAERSRKRPPTIRLRGDDADRSWDDLVLGSQRGRVDDTTLARFDGAIAYNLAVIVDDVWQGINQVVRGDDLAPATPTQLLLTELLGGQPAAYAHVPLVLGPTGDRLAKRDGSVTLSELTADDADVAGVRRWIGRSLGPAVAADAETLDEMLDSFRPDLLPATPITFDPALYRERRD